MLVGDLALPPVQRPRARKQRPARNNATLEKAAHECYPFLLVCDGGKNDDGIRMRHGATHLGAM